MPTCGSPEIHNKSLDGHRRVFRLFRRTAAGGMNTAGLAFDEGTDFSLSSDDKKETPPSLSVWAVPCTTIEQATAHAPERGDTHYACLSVADIRKAVIDAVDASVAPMDVVWRWIGSTKPGGNGHCGIVGMSREESAPPGSVKSTKELKFAYRAIRHELFEVARKHPVDRPVCEDD